VPGSNVDDLHAITFGILNVRLSRMFNTTARLVLRALSECSVITAEVVQLRCMSQGDNSEHNNLSAMQNSVVL
jgi:hypothetical protein